MKPLAAAAIVLAAWSAGAGAQAPPPAADAVRVPARLTLDEALQFAETRSPAHAEARARRAVAEAEAVGARLRPNPTLDVEFRGYPLFEPDLPPVLDSAELTIAIDQEFEPGGRRGLRRDAASLGARMSAAESDDVARRLRLDVQRAFLQVVLAQAELTAANDTLAGVDRVLALNRVRYEQGELSGVELRRLQVERHRFADDALVAELAVRNARSRLLALINVRPLDQPFEAVDPPVGAADPLPAPAAAPADGVSARADIRALRLAEQRAEADQKLQHALRIPPFSFGGGYQRDFGANAIVLRATIPLALSNRNEGGRARAAAERTLAASRTSMAEAAAELDLQLARNAVESSRTRLAAITTDYVRNAREALDIVLAAYGAGAATLIDYLDAQRAFRDAQRAEHRARYEYRVYTCELEAAAGAAWPGRR
jgi:cobalt-zinc-cadmium efflux system outer membrane protein